MSPEHPQYSIEERKVEFREVYAKISHGKLIETVQICLRCGSKLSFKRGRKRCPECLSLLRTRTMIVKPR